MAGETLPARKAAAALVRRVALKTGIVRRLTVGDDEIARFSRRFVADRTIGLGVRRVAELDPDRFRAAHFRVTLPTV